jgi:5-methylcytosine-specific restriction protein A
MERYLHARRHGALSVPEGARPSAIPVTLVCGPPASGKSAWVRAHAKPGDVVIDLDDCKVMVGGRRWDPDVKVRAQALRLRDRMLLELAERTAGRAFIIVGAPTADERQAWCQAFGIQPDDVVVLKLPAETCIARITADPQRAHAAEELIAAVYRWHQAQRDYSLEIGATGFPIDPRHPAWVGNSFGKAASQK